MTVVNAAACVDGSIKSFFYKSLTFYVYFLWEEKAIQSYFKYKKKRFHSVFKSGSHSFKCSYWILTMHADAEEKSYPKMGMF